jgi:alkylation response protein AidB-like acyl-CoA dehydrogenase
LSDRLQGRPLGPESAVQKALSAPHGQRVMAMALEWMGPRGLVQRAEPFANQSQDGLADELAGWSWGIWFSPAVTLGIGTTEIMKNVIAERMLDMPREDDPDVRKPWNDTQQKKVAS